MELIDTSVDLENMTKEQRIKALVRRVPAYVRETDHDCLTVLKLYPTPPRVEGNIFDFDSANLQNRNTPPRVEGNITPRIPTASPTDTTPPLPPTWWKATSLPHSPPTWWKAISPILYHPPNFRYSMRVVFCLGVFISR